MAEIDYTNKTKEEILNEFFQLQRSYKSFREQNEKDLSLLKQAELEVTKSEEKFRKAFMTSSDSVNINRLSDGMYVSINNGFTNILGYTAAEVIGKTSIELNIWVEEETRNILVNKLKDQGRVENYEAIFRKKGGDLVYGLMSASIIDLDGIPHLLNVTKDISGRKLIENALIQEQFLVDALMNNLTDHIYFKDRESKFIRINRAHAHSFGLPDPDFAAGKSDFDFFTEQAANKAFEDEQNIIRTGQSVFKEEKLTRKDNSDAWFSVKKMPLQDKTGNIIGTFGISRDITELKRRELESHVLFEITQGITTSDNLEELLKLMHNSLGKVIYAENCFVALHDYKTGLFSFPYFVDQFDSVPQPQSMGKSCTAYVFRTIKPFLFRQEEYEKLLKKNEVELVGSASPSWIGIPLQTPSKVIGVLVLQHYEIENVYTESDLRFLISVGSQIALSIERKQAEEEIKQKNELLLGINAEKDKFFSILAHDLRGPLSAFVAATQILTEEIQTMDIEDIREITVSMKTSATNIYNLLENLLEWSRIKRGTINFNPEKFLLFAKIDDCVKMILEQAKKKNITIGFSIPDNMEVYADSHMFDTVVRNLVSNAIKFTPNGGNIIISAFELHDNNIEIKIHDNGIGMKQDLISKLFIVNEKTSRSGTDGEPSTGLGLTLCKEFIEKHGGTINVESEEGSGSTFSFTIPELKIKLI